MAISIQEQPQQNPLVDGNQRVTLAWGQWFRAIRDVLSRVIVGSGSPIGVVVADRGTLYLRVDGAAGSTLYVKEAFDGTVNGWAAK